jgi:SAM-dependent methyltransferase
MPAPPSPAPDLPERISSRVALERRMFAEVNVSGIARNDQEVRFFTQVSALLRPDQMALDFGAGRGEWYLEDRVPFRRWLQTLKGRVAHVDGCDVDPAVLDNPALDAAQLFRPGEPLPYPDNRFDIVVARYVFEHVPDPDWLAAELLRVTRPGGWVCALTPNRWSYVAAAARLVPNALHRRVLRRVQPSRLEMDVFPTVYRLNTPRAIRRHFGDRWRFHYFRASYPSYHFDRAWIFRGLQLLHRLLPPQLQTSFYVFLQKR